MFNQMPMYTGMTQYNTMPSTGSTQPEMGQMQNQMPYAYGMTNENPMPSQPSPVSTLPPLFPSMMTPQLNPQAPFTTQNMQQGRFAHGGQVQPRGLSGMAEMLREQGDEDDSILAHINPEEAHYLGEHFGMDMNPNTGLPQFGKFSRLRKKASHHIRHTGAKMAPIVGTIAGNAILPGIGGIIGGTIGGGVGAKVRHKNVGKGMLKGAGMGAGLGFGMPMLGQGMSAMGAGNLGGGLSSMGAGQYAQGFGQLGKAFGIGAGAGNPGGAGLLGGLGGKRGPASNEQEGQTQGGGGILGTLLGNGGLGGLLLPLGLLGTALRKEKMKPAYPQPSFENVAAQVSPAALRKMWGPEDQPEEMQPYNREMIPQELTEDMLSGRAPFRYSPSYAGYADGGVVEYSTGGYIHGDSGGQDDNVHRAIPENSYIVNATAVSHLGDGNSLAGAKKLDHFFHNLKPHKGLSAYHMHEGGAAHRHVPAMVSEGEYEILPDRVSMLGKGNIKQGIKMLDNLQKNILKHKATKGLPPKAKSLMVYMQQRSAR